MQLQLVYTGDLSDKEMGSIPKQIILPPTQGSVMTIGRANDNDCFLFSANLPDSVRTTVSRYHVHVSTGLNNYTITDLDSINGTFVDGIRTTPRLATPFQAGSTIVIGGCAGIEPGEKPESYIARGRLILRAFEYKAMCVPEYSSGSRTVTVPAPSPREDQESMPHGGGAQEISGSGGVVRKRARMPSSKDDDTEEESAEPKHAYLRENAMTVRGGIDVRGDVVSKGNVFAQGNLFGEREGGPCSATLFCGDRCGQAASMAGGHVLLSSAGAARVDVPRALWPPASGSLPLVVTLTPLNGPMPSLHASVASDGRGFTLAGGVPSGRVSWIALVAFDNEEV